LDDQQKLEHSSEQHKKMKEEEEESRASPVHASGESTLLVQFYALLKKKVLVFVRDRKMLGIHILLPIIFVAVAIGIRVGLEPGSEVQPPPDPFTMNADSYMSALGSLRPSSQLPYAGILVLHEIQC
jgi:hypothetical protein